MSESFCWHSALAAKVIFTTIKSQVFIMGVRQTHGTATKLTSSNALS